MTVAPLDPDEVVYSISIEDLQSVAMEDLNRELTREEIDSLIDRLGDYISWFDAVSSAIADSKLVAGTPSADDDGDGDDDDEIGS